MIPDTGWRFMNPHIKGFQCAGPRSSSASAAHWQFAALEWGFTKCPRRPPLPGASYGSFAAACHYKDGTFVPAKSEAAPRSPESRAAFTFWHPDLVTLRVWLWYPTSPGCSAAPTH